MLLRELVVMSVRVGYNAVIIIPLTSLYYVMVTTETKEEKLTPPHTQTLGVEQNNTNTMNHLAERSRLVFNRPFRR